MKPYRTLISGQFLCMINPHAFELSDAAATESTALETSLNEAGAIRFPLKHVEH